MHAPPTAAARSKTSARTAGPTAARGASAALRSSGTAVNRMRALQQTIGNQATLRLLAARAQALKPLPDGSSEHAVPRVLSPSAAALPTLTAGRVNDPLEREADGVAERVIRTTDRTVPRLATTGAILQRNCATCAGEEARLARKETGSAHREGGAAPGIVHRVLATPGRPLDAAARGFLEPRFGRDLSHVRIHTDPTAAASARAVSAQAYTVGHHVAFAPGRYQPGTQAGLHLLAHELAHTEQQTGGRADTSSTLQRDVDDDAERERERDEDGAGPDYDGGDATYESEPDRDDQGQEGGSQGGEPSLGGDFTGGGGEGGGGGSDDTYGEPDQSGSEGPGAGYEQGDGDAGSGQDGTDQDGGGLTIDFPDVELFGSMRKCGTWSFASGEVPIYTAHFKVPKVGPVDVTFYVRGTASLTACAVLGPGRLQNIRLTLDPLAGSYRGTAELAIPATLTGDLALSGTSGEHADYAGIFELIRGEGMLTGQGKAVNTTTYTVGVQAQYSGGNFSFDVNEALTNCLALTLNASAGADIFAIGCPTPCISGRWDVGDWATGECWNLGVHLGYGAQGFDYEIEGADLSLDKLLLASLGHATPSGVTGGIIDCLTKPCGGGKSGAGPIGMAPGTSPVTSAGPHMAPTGTKADPIPMEWYKPLHYYPSQISLYPGMYYRDKPGQKLGEDKIGVEEWPHNWVNDKTKTLMKINAYFSSSENKRFIEVIKKQGRDMSVHEEDADHVVDRVFNGYDRFSNLWPMDSKANRKAGRTQVNQKVSYCDATDPPTKAPYFGKISSPDLVNRFFYITVVKEPP